MQRLTRLVLLAASLALAGCTCFETMRSFLEEVAPGCL
jgi:hypothetical protein